MQATCSDLDDINAKLVAGRLSGKSMLDVATDILGQYTTLPRAAVYDALKQRGDENVIADMVASRLSGDIRNEEELAWDVLNIAFHNVDNSKDNYRRYRPFLFSQTGKIIVSADDT